MRISNLINIIVSTGLVIANGLMAYLNFTHTPQISHAVYFTIAFNGFALGIAVLYFIISIAFL